MHCAEDVVCRAAQRRLFDSMRRFLEASQGFLLPLKAWLSGGLSRLWLSAGLASYGQSSPPSPPSLASQGWRPPSLASQRLVAVSGSPPHHTYLPPRTCRYGTVQSLFIKEQIDAAFPSMNKRLLTRSDGRSRPVVTPPPFCECAAAHPHPTAPEHMRIARGF